MKPWRSLTPSSVRLLSKGNNISERRLGPVGKPQVRMEGAHTGPAADMEEAGNICMPQASEDEDTCRSLTDMEAVPPVGGDGTSPADTRRK